MTTVQSCACADGRNVLSKNPGTSGHRKNLSGRSIARCCCVEQALLTNVELNQFQAILLARVAELERVLRGRDLIRVEQSADQVDEVQQASERALAISNLDRETQQLRQARRALRRIQQGSFGVCEQCGESIHFKRLSAVPWSAFCIECQEQLDRNRQEARIVGLDDSDLIRGNEAA